jgi:ribosomal protein S18 acetylase RimI-like enzyme
MEITFMTIATGGTAGAAGVLARAFADYMVKIAATEEVLRQMERIDGVDFAHSLVVSLDGEPAGAALIARRGPVSRLAGMALVPEARGRGVGRAVMERLLGEARARGDRRMVLEVIEQNTAAVRLYEAVGFMRKRRLVGFAGPAPGDAAPVPGLAVASLGEVAAAVSRMEEEAEWPWQISGETVAQLPASVEGYRLDGAWVALQNAAGPTVSVRALAVDGTERREERASRLLRAVMARHPAEGWRMGALWPEELAGWFGGAGLVRQELTQWQMGRELD